MVSSSESPTGILSLISWGSSTTTHNDDASDFHSSFEHCSDSLNSAEQRLAACLASASPGLAELSLRLNAVRDEADNLKELQRLVELRTTTDSELDSSIFVLILRASPLYRIMKTFPRFRTPNKNFKLDMSNLEASSVKIAKDAGKTSKRREPYLPLFNIVVSNELPDRGCLPNIQGRAVALSHDDAVNISSSVRIKEGSYLDSPKYEVSGPALVILTEKTINCIVHSQNPLAQLQPFKKQLDNMATALFHHNLQIAWKMKEFPDDLQLHAKCINRSSRIINHFTMALNSPTNNFEPYSRKIWEMVQEQELYLEESTGLRLTDHPVNDISESDVEIVLVVHGEKYVHKKESLTWEYVWEKVLPPLKLDEVDFTKSRDTRSSNGGFASIYEATLSSGRKVAIKCLYGSGESERELCLRFIREVYIWWIASFSQHPNVHSLLGISHMDSPKLPVMVSSWCNDGNLADFLRRPLTNMSRKEQVQLALQIARGLQHLHSLNIIHGDLKPDNILVKDRCVKLHDFGISRILGDAHGLSSKVHGSYSYQAPEVLQALDLAQTLRREDKPQACATKASDIYSFGNVLFECLTRRIPFDGLSNKQKISEAVLRDLKRPLDHQYDAGIGGEHEEELRSLLNACWHRDPAPRPSVDYVVTKLEEIEEKILKEEVD